MGCSYLGELGKFNKLKQNKDKQRPTNSVITKVVIKIIS